MPEIAYVNGQFMPIRNATVSIEDRGFQFADSIYEVVVAPGGRPFRCPEHLRRLQASADGIDLDIHIDELDLAGVIKEGITRCGFDDVLVYVQITRGAAPRDHVAPPDMRPTIVVTFKEKKAIDAALRAKGISLETAEDVRWRHCFIKATALLPNVMIKNAARKKGFFDAALVGSDGFVRETTAANLFIVESGAIITPPATERILHGITRGFVIECAEKAGIPLQAADISVDRMINASEVFISSSTINVLAVTRIDTHHIGDGQPGPITGRLSERFEQAMMAPQ